MHQSFFAEHAQEHELPAAFRLIFQHLDYNEREGCVKNALRLARQGEFDASNVWVVRSGRQLIGAMVCLPVPGASGLIWPPQAVRHSPSAEIEDVLLQEALHHLRQQGAKLAQALVLPAEGQLAEPLLRNGFRHITRLWYMRHELDFTLEILLEKSQLTCFDYNSCDLDTFHQTLLRSYVDTRDCPEVNGVRTLDEIIVGHQAQGAFDPARWWLALHGDQPVGVLLLTQIEEWVGWDIAYVGVVPEARRKGFGRELTCKALLAAKSAGAAQVTLAVDVRNAPAWQLYQRLGFAGFEEREVYLAIWQ